MELKPGYKQTEVGVIPEDWDVTATRRDFAPNNSGVATQVRYDEYGVPVSQSDA